MSIQFIAGCMYSGKTRELIRRLNVEQVGNVPVVLFKPLLDTRHDSRTVISHDEVRYSAVPVRSTSHLVATLQVLSPQPYVVGIDEVQFFDDAIVDLCLQQSDLGKTVIVSGLPLDFRGEPFTFRDSSRHVGELMAHSLVDMMRAKCTYAPSGGTTMCRRDADFTQRLFPNGDPVPYQDPLIHIGGKETVNERRYEARCLSHHFVPGHPRRNGNPSL